MDRAERHRRLLATVGERIREGRRERAWTQADLARQSGVSLRFISQLEAGEGNISLGRLADVADALGLPFATLVREDETARRIALLGVRGAGKSTVGPLVASRLRVPFVELDARVEKLAGLSLEGIFEMHGEPYYRRLTREALAALTSAHRGFVVATGGGIVSSEDEYRLLQSTCTTIWLRARPEDHWSRVIAQGDARPMRKNPHAMAELRALFAARTPLYESARFVVDTAGKTPEAVAEEIAQRVA